jgi:hypothetical protein
MASIHLLPAQEENKPLFASDLAKLVNDVHQPHSTKFCVDVKYLSHALLQYYDILKKRFGWKTCIRFNENHWAEPIGNLPIKPISVEVAPKFSCPTYWTPQNSFETRIETARKVLSKPYSPLLEDAEFDPVAFKSRILGQFRAQHEFARDIAFLAVFGNPRERMKEEEEEASSSSSGHHARYTGTGSA